MHGFAPPQEAQAQPGALELLQELSLRYNLGLISFRPRHETEQALEAAGIPLVLFPAVATMDDLTHLSPQNEAVTLCLTILESPLDQTLLVGDTEWVLRPAQATSAVRCGVLCGLGVESDFIDADLVVPCTSALRDWL
ncbi:MAG: HAD family hydrolase [Caldilineae bacterium]|nr:MAG: HAD family hydrolase [Caldilineae bacterium]